MEEKDVSEEQQEEPVRFLTEEEISVSFGNRLYNTELPEGFILDCA